ncbi:hypothetical protein HPP92_007234 [Vanilla planifolia]|uniref:CCT domain-containing protein n=1 Tax=Vanilla planifolia TaxID=51239 RepID=A0A835V8H8_VANPL|nr:hypothetical protein HPP92_007234 [Vanilla planifolia]
MDIILPLPNGEINGLASLDSQIRPEGKFNGQELGQDKSSTEKFDLLEAINNQSLHNSCNGSSLANSEDNLFGAIDLNQKSSSMPSLDLSLKYTSILYSISKKMASQMYYAIQTQPFHLFLYLLFCLRQIGIVIKQITFPLSCRYNNNSRVVPALANPAKFQAQKQGSIDSSIEPSPDHSAANPVQHFGLISKPEDAKFTIDLIPRPDEDTFQSDPIRFIHFLVPVNAMPFNATGSNPLLQPIFYPQPALASWSTMPSMMQEAFVETPIRQADSTDYPSYKIQNLEEEDYTKEENAEAVQEEKRISMVVGETTNVCNDKDIIGTQVNQLEGCINGGTNSDVHCVSQRQAALAKFGRRERTDVLLRRQKLAEQRPRLKGQFVRQA